MIPIDCKITNFPYTCWYKSGCVALTRCITMLHFASSSSNVLLTFQAKNNIRSALLALHLLKSRTKAITRGPQILTYVVREKGMEYKGEHRWALVEPWCKHWSCCGWRKGMSPEKATLNSEEIKLLAIVSIKLHLSEGISKGVNEWVLGYANQSCLDATK